MWTFYFVICAFIIVAGTLAFTHVGTLFLIAIAIVSGAGTLISAFLTAASLIGIYEYGAIDAIKYFIAVIIFGLISAGSFFKFQEIKNEPERVRPQTYFVGVAKAILGFSLICILFYISYLIENYLKDFSWYGKRDSWKLFVIAFLLCFSAFWIFLGSYIFYDRIRYKRERKRLGLD